MIYARINLSETNYSLMKNCKKLTCPFPHQLEPIYDAYCRYKKFKSVMPIFREEYSDDKNEVYGYFNKDEKLVAFSLLRCYNIKNVEAIQFAWDYENPALGLGIRSLKNECAIYKKRGFDYLYLGQADDYKSKIDGFEILGGRE